MAALCFVTSIGAFADSFFGLTLDKIGMWVFLLHGGIFLLFIPMVAVEYAAIKASVFFSTEFLRGKPRGVILGIRASFALFLIIFVLFLGLSHGASPQIRDGQFVLDNHGQIVRPLSQTEYVNLKEWELRMFASGWMCFYLTLAAYWWFPRNRTLILSE